MRFWMILELGMQESSCWGLKLSLNIHYFHIIGDGHQPYYTRGIYQFGEFLFRSTDLPCRDVSLRKWLRRQEAMPTSAEWEASRKERWTPGLQSVAPVDGGRLCPFKRQISIDMASICVAKDPQNSTTRVVAESYVPQDLRSQILRHKHTQTNSVPFFPRSSCCSFIHFLPPEESLGLWSYASHRHEFLFGLLNIAESTFV